jgi:hypothetical protein
VAHLSCLKMKVQPKDEWHCKDCHVKMAQRRQTRNLGKDVHHKKPAGAVHQSNGDGSSRNYIKMGARRASGYR